MILDGEWLNVCCLESSHSGSHYSRKSNRQNVSHQRITPSTAEQQYDIALHFSLPITISLYHLIHTANLELPASQQLG